MPLREALRGLRHLLRRGGQALRDTAPADSLPRPAAEIAKAVLREADQFVQGVDAMASGIAKSVLGGGATSALMLHELGQDEGAQARFAAAVYQALSSVLRRLGAVEAFVSEVAARRAFAAVTEDATGQDDARTAAGLVIGLLEVRVIRDSAAALDSRVAPADIEPVAIFAVMLWLLSERSEQENQAALESATDLAVALSDEVVSGCRARDAAKIEALLRTYACHV